jgi:hypothetical protein
MIKVSTFLRECLNKIEMKKYLPPYERELTSFPPRSSKSLCSVDGTYTTPHASARTEMFQGKKIKNSKKIQSHRGFSIVVMDDGYATTLVGLKCFKKKKKKQNKKKFEKIQKNSIPPRFQHRCRGRRLCCNLGGIEMFQENKIKNKIQNSKKFQSHQGFALLSWTTAMLQPRWD